MLSTPQYSICAESKKLLEQVHKQEPAVGFTTTRSPNSNSGGTNTRAVVLVGFMSNEKLKVFKYGSLPLMHVGIQYLNLIAQGTILRIYDILVQSALLISIDTRIFCHSEHAGSCLIHVMSENYLMDGWLEYYLYFTFSSRYIPCLI